MLGLSLTAWFITLCLVDHLLLGLSLTAWSIIYTIITSGFSVHVYVC